MLELTYHNGSHEITAQKLWDTAGRLNQDTGFPRLAEIFAPTPGDPAWRQNKNLDANFS